MSRKPKTKRPGHVKQIVHPTKPGGTEKAEIVVQDADPLYRELRIENRLQDENGEEVKLKKGAEVDVTVETDTGNTVPVKN